MLRKQIQHLLASWVRAALVMSTWIVLTAGLLILLRCDLIIFNFWTSPSSHRVWFSWPNSPLATGKTSKLRRRSGTVNIAMAVLQLEVELIPRKSRALSWTKPPQTVNLREEHYCSRPHRWELQGPLLIWSIEEDERELDLNASSTCEWVALSPGFCISTKGGGILWWQCQSRILIASSMHKSVHLCCVVIVMKW